MEKLLRNSPFAFHRKSQVQAEKYFEKDILLLDTVGELPDFFAAADVTFVGGSLVDIGGHNVLEPARFQKPVLFGPYMSNFKSIAEEMKQSGAAPAGAELLAFGRGVPGGLRQAGAPRGAVPPAVCPSRRPGGHL